MYECVMVKYILNGWLQYRIDLMKMEQNGCKYNYMDIAMTKILLDNCRKGLILIGIIDGNMLMDIA